MGKAVRIVPRDSAEEVVVSNIPDRDAKVNAAIAAINESGGLIQNVTDYQMPSASDGSVNVTHIYYRRVVEV